MIPEIEATQERLEQLCRQYGVERLEVFGSAISDHFTAGSDIDFVVEFLPEATGPGYFERFFGLMEELESLYGRDIDLVVRSAIRNIVFREAVDRTSQLLYAA